MGLSFKSVVKPIAKVGKTVGGAAKSVLSVAGVGGGGGGTSAPSGGGMRPRSDGEPTSGSLPTTSPPSVPRPFVEPMSPTVVGLPTPPVDKPPLQGERLDIPQAPAVKPVDPLIAIEKAAREEAAKERRPRSRAGTLMSGDPNGISGSASVSRRILLGA